MSEEVLDGLRGLPGAVCTVVISGHVDEHYAQALSEMRSWCDRNGFHQIEWKKVHSPFVEAGRDSCIRHALDPRGDGSQDSYAWVLQVDADAAPFPPNALLRLLHTAFVTHPDADVVGAYAQLKHPPYLPVIDTGSGTWESHFPGEGVLPVIRTGGHFLLVKPEICRRFGPPWFRTRNTIRPIEALAEVDNFARLHEDGRNDLTKTETWRNLLGLAKKSGGGGTSTVGEDSGFCDSVKAAGGTIYVNTDVFVGHVGKRVVTPELLNDEMKKREEMMRAAVGIWE